MPKAQCQAWLNYVQEVEIELFGLESLENAMLPRELDEFSLSNGSEYEDKGYYRRLNEGLREIRLISLNPGSFSDPVSCIRTIKTINDRYEHSSHDSIAEHDTAKLHYPLMGGRGVEDFIDELAIVRVSLVQSDMGCPGSLQRQSSVGPLRPGPSSVVIDITSE